MTAALAAGTVPRDNPVKMWAGTGTGSQCVICGERLRPNDVEYEIEFASGRALVLDRQCHELWDECRASRDGVH